MPRAIVLTFDVRHYYHVVDFIQCPVIRSSW